MLGVSSKNLFLGDGSLVWFDHPEHSWLPGVVSSQEKEVIRVKLAGYPQPVDAVHSSKTVIERSVHSDEDLEDMVKLADLNEPAILHNLRQRYVQNKIYTYVGPVLISVNPYKDVDNLYNSSVKETYRNISKLSDLPPHIFGIVSIAYKNMIKDSLSQSILISGESGAGKTESTRMVLNFLGDLSGKHAKSSNSSSVGQKLTEISPILEAFGNAKTMQNDNSSRFGKFFQVFFDGSGSIVGVKVQDYLLEKSRVVASGKGERNYHIFYMLIEGLPAADKARIGIRSGPEQYKYLSSCGCFAIPGRNEKVMFEELVHSMKVLGLSEDEICVIYIILSAVLLLGEINFTVQPGSTSASVEMLSRPMINQISQCLGINPQSLDHVLTNRSVQARASSLYAVPLSVSEADVLRHSLAKLLYSRLFQYLTARTNELLGGMDSFSPESTKFIGVLDIFGFEIFEKNSFEQFCINYANERLQQIFNMNLFVVEQDIYRSEGIKWENIQFVSNDGCVKLIDKKPMGILSMLDEECFFPNGSDATFLDKISTLYKGDSFFEKPLKLRNAFVIKHYAQDVPYDVTGFLDKNRDSMPESLLSLMKDSNIPLIRKIFEDQENSGNVSSDINAESANNSGITAAGVRPKPAARKSAMPGGSIQKTLGGQFKDQLEKLAQTLNLSVPHFVRCIKPNESKRQSDFRGVSSLRQLRCAGVLDTIRIRASGYSCRPTMQEFLFKYGSLLSGKDLKALKVEDSTSSQRERSELIMRKVKADTGNYQIGHARIFFKVVVQDQLNEVLQKKIEFAAKLATHLRRGVIVRRWYLKTKSAALVFQSAFRCYCAKKELKRLRKEKERKLLEELKRKEEEKRKEAERVRKEREEKEKLEKERIELELREKEIEKKLLEEKLEKERLEQVKQEKARIEKEMAEKEEKERLKREQEKLLLEQTITAEGPSGKPGPSVRSGSDNIGEFSDFPDDIPEPPPDIPDYFPSSAPPPPDEISKVDSDEMNEWTTLAVTSNGQYQVKEVGAKKESTSIFKSLLGKSSDGLPLSNEVKTGGGFSVLSDSGLDGEELEPVFDVSALQFNWAVSAPTKDDKEVGDAKDEGGDDADFDIPSNFADGRRTPVAGSSVVGSPASMRKGTSQDNIIVPGAINLDDLGEDDDSSSQQTTAPVTKSVSKPSPLSNNVSKGTDVESKKREAALLQAKLSQSQTNQAGGPFGSPSKADEKGPKGLGLTGNHLKVSGSGSDTLAQAQGSGSPLFPDLRKEPLKNQGLSANLGSTALGVKEVSSITFPTVSTENEEPSSTVEIVNGLEVKYANPKDPKVARLVFGKFTKPAPLHLPKDINTSTDYSDYRTKPFSYNDRREPLNVVSPDPPPIPEDVKNPDFPEPVGGLIATDAPVKDMEKSIKLAKYQAYEPKHAFPRLPALKKMSEIPSKNKISGVDAVTKGVPLPSEIRVFNAASLPKEYEKKLSKLLNDFVNLEYLNLSSSGLSKLPWVIPKLRYCDLHDNQISDLDGLCKFISKSSFLEVLKLEGNPVVSKKDFRPRVVACCPRLRRLNGEDVQRSERIEGIKNFGSSVQRKHIEMVRWDVCVSTSREIGALSSWDPQKLTSLTLQNMQLQQFHVGLMVNLRLLDLRQNFISSTLNSGLERLQKCNTVNLSDNRITRSGMFEPFPIMERLLSIDLRGNKDGKNELKDYRLLLIFATRHLRGTNRHNGLVELDGETVTTEERVLAVETFFKKKGFESFAWRAWLMNYVGHKQLRTPDYVQNLKEIVLPQCRLRQVNLSGLRSLVMLDLAGNFLTRLDGLDECVRLRFLNLSGNEKLDMKVTLASIAKYMTKLEQVCLCMPDGGEESVRLGSVAEERTTEDIITPSVPVKEKKLGIRSPSNSAYRFAVLRCILLPNPKLNYLDSKYITLSERIGVYSVNVDKKMTAEVDAYRFKVALVENCTFAWNRDLHPSDVSNSKHPQYDPANITCLRRLAALGLQSAYCNFGMFLKLEEVNLANNDLVDICKIGLEKCKNLRILDVHGNKIKNSLDQIASMIDGFSHLECIAVRGNPFISTPSFPECRFKLIGNIKSLRKVDCQLRVIDTEISVMERIAAWKQVGGKEDETEAIRWKIVMFLRVPPKVKPDTLTTLDLSGSGFSTINLTEFKNLSILSLARNSFSLLQGTSLESLTELKVLDLSFNLLLDVREPAWLVTKLSKLQTIGLVGNRWSKDYEKKGGWRHHFLVLLPQLHEKECSLKMIDDVEITADEVIDAWQANRPSKDDARNARFRVLMLTKMPLGMTPATILHLDLSNCGLESLDFTGLKSLTRLSVAGNGLKSLKNSNIHQLDLHALDISYNKIPSMSEVTVLLKSMQKLRTLVVYHNPFYEKEDSKTRIKFLSSLLQFFNPVSLPTRSLNGTGIEIPDLCDACEAEKQFSAVEVEEFRLKLVLRRKNGDVKRAVMQTLDDGTKVVTSLDISGAGFKSLAGLKSIPHRLVALNASNNFLQKMEVDVFAQLPNLKFLDLSQNKVSSLKDILNVVKASCPVLEILNIEKSTKNPKETSGSRDYNNRVFQVLRDLHLCDRMRNPRIGSSVITFDPKVYESVKTSELASSGFTSAAGNQVGRTMALMSAAADSQSGNVVGARSRVHSFLGAPVADTNLSAGETMDLPEIDMDQVLKYGDIFGDGALSDLVNLPKK